MMMPARISPTTAGMRIRSATSAATFAASRTTRMSTRTSVTFTPVRLAGVRVAEQVAASVHRRISTPRGARGGAAAPRARRARCGPAALPRATPGARSVSRLTTAFAPLEERRRRAARWIGGSTTMRPRRAARRRRSTVGAAPWRSARERSVSVGGSGSRPRRRGAQPVLEAVVIGGRRTLLRRRRAGARPGAQPLEPLRLRRPVHERDIGDFHGAKVRTPRFAVVSPS